MRLTDRGAPPALIVVLAVVVVAAVAVAGYALNMFNPRNTQTASPSPSSASSQGTGAPVATPTPSPASDQELITAAVRASLENGGQGPASSTKITLNRLERNCAMVGLSVESGPGGGMYLLKKSQGTWTVAWHGQNFDPAKEAQLGFPQGFTSSVTMATVLYTY